MKREVEISSKMNFESERKNKIWKKKKKERERERERRVRFTIPVAVNKVLFNTILHF